MWDYILMVLFLEAELMENLKIGKDGQEDADASPNSYPQRPAEPDCKYYLRTGCCRYGSKCKYNHPTVTEQVVTIV